MAEFAGAKTELVKPAASAAKPSPLSWADRLRNVATLMVIAIHVSGPVAESLTTYNGSAWWVANLWDAMCRPAVPLFVMLSGFLLLSKDYPLIPFLKRRFSRVLIPALFWMVIYLVYNHIAKGDPATVAEAGKKLLLGPVHYHLWFIYLIIGLYLVYPMLRAWVRQASELEFRFFFLMCIIGAWGYKILYVFFGLGIGVYFELFTNNAGYFVLGYYLGTKATGTGWESEGRVSVLDSKGLTPWRGTDRQLKWIGLALVIGGTAVTAIGTWWASQKYGGHFHSYFYDYLTPNVGLSAAGWFLLARFSWGKKPLLDFERDFAAASFGIYFCHVLVMDWWGQCGYWHSLTHPLANVPGLVGLVAGMSFLLISLLRTIPGGDKVT